MAAASNSYRRILVVRNDRLGDLVLTLPALEAVRQTWPSAHVTALVSSYAAPLLVGSPYLDDLLEDDAAQSAWQLGRRLRQQHFDAALVINTSKRACLAVRLAGIPTRVCWGYKPVGWLTGNRRVYLHRSRPPVHEAQFALAFARRLGATTQLADTRPRLVVDPQATRSVLHRIERDLGTQGPLFGVHPGNGNSAFNWPLDHYAQLVSRLADHGRVLVTGSVAERPLLESLRDQLSPRARGEVMLATDFTLPELVSALGQLTALTASSTGPLHVAAVLGTPVVGLFSPHPAQVPAKWSPLGEQHTVLVAPLAAGQDVRVAREQGQALMARISVEQVLAANLRYAAAQSGRLPSGDRNSSQAA